MFTNMCQSLTRMSAVKSPADVFAKQKLEVQQCTGGTLLNRTSLYDGQLEFADANIAGLTSMSAGKDSYRVFRMKNSQFKN